MDTLYKSVKTIHSNIDELRKQFYFDGYVQINMEPNADYEKLCSLRRNNYLTESEIKTHCDWEQAYNNTAYDFSYNSILDNDVLLSILHSQQIPQFINELVGQKMCLGDLAYRKTFKSASYTGWHRDTYLDKNGKLVGRTPPLVKMAYYPVNNGISTVQLKIMPRTHNRYYTNYYLDKIQTLLSAKLSINSSDDSLVIFNSAIYHSAGSDAGSMGAERIIYNFCSPGQMQTFEKRKEINERYIAIGK